MFYLQVFLKMQIPSMPTDLRDLFPSTSQLDQKSVQALLSALMKNHDTNKFDYLKFKESVSSLEKIVSDESTSYKSAFATASTMGLTKESLLKSVERYKYTLDQERENFAKALLNQRKIKIDGRKSEVQELEQKIKDNRLKIKELEREIDIFQNRIDTVDQDVELANTLLEGTKEKFLNVYNTISDVINSDIQSISKYL